MDWVESPYHKQLWSTMLWRVEKETPLRHFVIAFVERAIFKLDTRGVRVNNMHSQKLIVAICPKKGHNFDISTVHIYNHYYQYFVTAQKVSFLSSLFLLLLLLLGFCTTLDICIKMRPKHLLCGKKSPIVYFENTHNIISQFGMIKKTYKCPNILR